MSGKIESADSASVQFLARSIHLDELMIYLFKIGMVSKIMHQLN